MPATLDTPADRALRRAVAQECFDFLVPGKEWHSPLEMAKYTGRELSFIYAAIDQGQICVHAHNAGSGEKMHYRISRGAVIAYLLSTARYEPTDFLRHLCSLIDRLGPTSTQLLIEHAIKRRTQLSA